MMSFLKRGSHRVVPAPLVEETPYEKGNHSVLRNDDGSRKESSSSSSSAAAAALADLTNEGEDFSKDDTGTLVTETSSVATGGSRSSFLASDAEEDTVFKALEEEDISDSSSGPEMGSGSEEPSSLASTPAQGNPPSEKPDTGAAPLDTRGGGGGTANDTTRTLAAAIPPFSRAAPFARPLHRRTSSAMPRLETLHEDHPTVPAEKPPLPPRKYSLSSSTDVRGKAAATTDTVPLAIEKGSLWGRLPAYPRVPSLSSSSVSSSSPSHLPPRAVHRRASSSPTPPPPELSADIPTLQRQLKQFQQQYGDRHVMVAHAYNWLGNAYFRRGRTEAALQAYKQAVVACGNDDSDESNESDTNSDPSSSWSQHLADAYANIGTCYWTTGQVAQAVVFLQHALAVHEYHVLASGGDPNGSPAVAAVQYQLGLALTLQGTDYEAAVRSLAHARAIRERLWGPWHMDVARTLDAMGQAYFYWQGPCDWHAAALACHRQALSIKEKEYQQQQQTAVTASSLVSTMMHMVAVFRAVDNLPEAGAWMHRVLSLQKKDFVGGGRRKSKTLCADIGGSLVTLGEIYDGAQQHREGTACYREADLYLEKARVPREDSRRVAVRERLLAE